MSNYPGQLLSEKVYYGKPKTCQASTCDSPVAWVQGRYWPMTTTKGRAITRISQLVCSSHASEQSRAWAERWKISEGEDGKKGRAFQTAR